MDGKAAFGLVLAIVAIVLLMALMSGRLASFLAAFFSPSLLS
jgi:hypothetical protein